MSWEITSTILNVALGSGCLVALMKLRAERRRRRDDSVEAGLRDTLDALVQLRTLCRRRINHRYRRPSLDDLQEQEASLDAACIRTLSEEVCGKVRAYRDVARVWVSGDVDLNETKEEDAYEAAGDAIRTCLQKTLKP
jgi:hypothetical protein